MIQDIRQVFLANLEKLEWMDEPTKIKAKAKVQSPVTFTLCNSSSLLNK